MYFISHHAWLLKTAYAIPLWLRYLLTIVLWIIIFGLWYFFAYQSLFGLENSYKQNIKILEDQLNQMHVEQKQLNVLEQSCMQKKKSMQTFYQQQESFEQKIATLLRLLQEYNLSIHSYTPSNEVKKEWYTKIPTLFKTQGNFNDIILFLQNLSQASLIAGINSIDIQKIQDNLLQISLLLDIIMFHEEKHV